MELHETHDPAPAKAARPERRRPDVGVLLGLLNEHGVRYLVTGSAP